MDINVRPALDKDRTSIASLHADSCEQTYNSVFTTSFLKNEARANLARHWGNIKLKPNDVVLIAETGDMIVGFIAVSCSQRPIIENLHVRLGCKSQGIGSALMRVAIKRLQELGHSTVSLWVLSDNHSALGFYRRLGGIITESSKKDIFGKPLQHKKIEWTHLSSALTARLNN